MFFNAVQMDISLSLTAAFANPIAPASDLSHTDRAYQRTR